MVIQFLNGNPERERRRTRQPQCRVTERFCRQQQEFHKALMPQIPMIRAHTPYYLQFKGALNIAYPEP